MRYMMAAVLFGLGISNAVGQPRAAGPDGAAGLYFNHCYAKGVLADGVKRSDGETILLEGRILGISSRSPEYATVYRSSSGDWTIGYLYPDGTECTLLGGSESILFNGNPIKEEKPKPVIKGIGPKIGA